MREVDDQLLAQWPLPDADGDADKEDRGRVLIVAGSGEVPGAAVLAGIAALRAGAGKLVIATVESAAAMVAAAVPEARVVSLPESPGGGPSREGVEALRDVAPRAAAVVVGPGMVDARATAGFVGALLPLVNRATLLLDALAMDAIGSLAPFSQDVIVTPHAGEMAHLTGITKDDVCDDPESAAWRFAQSWRAVVALKGATTCIVSPRTESWLHSASCPGLATSGSGDVLAGIIGGLAARGATAEQAAVWGVALHARAGEALAQRSGSLGFLARDLAAEVPRLMDELRPRHS